ncbi:MAG: carbamoyltransferase [Planctomycetes bacterium]|nr:carbamoyltransferase [Planctomycetota bacterium]
MTAVLGIYTGHDPAVCLVVDGQVAVMIEEERLTRVKHGLPKSVRDLWPRFGGRFGYFPWASVAYCLDAARLGIDDLDAIVLPEDATACDMAGLLPVKDRSRILVSTEPAHGAHHHRHALSAFLASPFDRAAVLVVDGDGTVSPEGYEAESGYLFEDRARFGREVFKNRYPQGQGLRAGLGWLYEYASAILGFVNTRVGYLGEPGKTMGLAPYGGPSPALEDPWVVPGEGFALDFAPFHAWLAATGNHKRLRFDSRERALVIEESAIPREAADLAWKAQAELERGLLHLVGRLHAATGARDLCIAGGVGLNSVANARIVREGPFERVFIQPAAHDAGQAIGLAYEGWLRLGERGRALPPLAPTRHAYSGRPHDDAELAALLDQAALPYTRLADDAALADDCAAELAQGRIVGWFQGGSEHGPRALGHRSILADPRDPGMKDRLNARVKFREGFRPFAPSVLRARAAEVFELEGESPYMLLVVPVREAWRARVPAITHVDGTARVQTVDPEVEPRYHALIEAFARRTGVPLVLNTSFNLRGMPIVESPRDALQCFLYTDMDALYLGRLKVRRPDARRLVPSAAPGWRFVVENELSWGGQRTRVRYQRGDDEQVEVRPVPELVTLCSLLDGKRSLHEALATALGQEPPPDVLAACVTLLQMLLRQGALRLRLGAMEL